MKHPVVRMRCQWYAWELLTILGHVLPTPAELGAGEYDRETIDQIWENTGCLSAFWATDLAAIDRSRILYAMIANIDGVSKNRSPPQESAFVPFIPCTCEQIHTFEIHVFGIIAIGSGYWSDEQIDRLDIGRWNSGTVLERSHLCGVDWCHNPLHRPLEKGAINSNRNKCFSCQQLCHHQPKCLVDTFKKNNNIGRLIAKTVLFRQQHNDPQVRSPQAGDILHNCTVCGEQFTSRQQLLDHVIIEHRLPEAGVEDNNCVSCHCESFNFAIAPPERRPRTLNKPHAETDRCTQQTGNKVYLKGQCMYRPENLL